MQNNATDELYRTQYFVRMNLGSKQVSEEGAISKTVTVNAGNEPTPNLMVQAQN